MWDETICVMSVPDQLHPGDVHFVIEFMQMLHRQSIVLYS
uniref:Uncharacterized protein n=1 Tax=Arundo donax TaxID=35708 RepID=A0A0A9BT93_ARUDO